MIHAEQDELVLTTPYLVPDDSLLRALRGAAGRGVTVRLIVPEKVGFFLTRHASRSYYDDLLDIGVEIYLYRGGLLHTKSIMADGEISMFGTVNLDMRSLAKWRCSSTSQSSQKTFALCSKRISAIRSVFESAQLENRSLEKRFFGEYASAG